MRDVLVCWLFALIVSALLVASELPRDPDEAHKYADGVLLLRFSAALNEFAYKHPRDKKEGTYDHVQQLDIPDHKRWSEARRAWREYEECMKKAGYE